MVRGPFIQLQSACDWLRGRTLWIAVTIVMPTRFAHCWLTLRANIVRSRLAVIKTNDATHNPTSIALRYVAVGKEIPMPVTRAT